MGNEGKPFVKRYGHRDWRVMYYDGKGLPAHIRVPSWREAMIVVEGLRRAR